MKNQVINVLSELLSYKAEIVVDTTNLPEEEWLAYRRQGIGGSDVAAVLGVSPFTTARDLYYDKLNIVNANNDDDNWVQKEIGHLLEDLVAEIFHVKTGYRIFQIKKMFRHPIHKYMLADVDYFVELPDGTIAILEIKTTNRNAIDKWWDGDIPIVPLYYSLQGRQYMAVLNLNRVYYCCLYGNNENEIIIRHIDRDLEYESEMIALEECFWLDHVLTKNPPPYTENGDQIIESARRHFGAADPNLPDISLSLQHSVQIARYLELQRAKSALDSQSNEIGTEMQRIKGIIISEMGKSCRASCDVSGIPYEVTFKPSYKRSINKNSLERLQAQYPDVYDKFVTISESRIFRLRPIAEEEAA